ncbi:MAG: hypothetical protein ABIH50_06040 [bacterium]
MKIGIAKEKTPGETRVALLPEEVARIVKAKNQVFVEKDAGAGIFIPNEEYKAAGANIMEDPADIYSKDLVVKLKVPTPQEFHLLKIKNNVLLSMFHHQQQPWNVDLLKSANSYVVALEMLKNEAGERLVECNRMTGEQGMLMAFNYALKTPEECRVLMLGYGEVASGALQAAFALGSYVKIMRRADFAQVKHYLKDKDIVVNALKWPDEKRQKKEYLVSREMLKILNKGAQVLDLAVDYPGPIETTRPTTISDPFYFEEGIRHISIYGYPALSPISSSRRYSRQIVEIVLQIASNGLGKAPEYIKKAIVKG